jgi:hypothetical protein
MIINKRLTGTAAKWDILGALRRNPSHFGLKKAPYFPCGAEKEAIFPILRRATRLGSCAFPGRAAAVGMAAVSNVATWLIIIKGNRAPKAKDSCDENGKELC